MALSSSLFLPSFSSTPGPRVLSPLLIHPRFSHCSIERWACHSLYSGRFSFSQRPILKLSYTISNLFGAGILTLFVPSLTKALGNNHNQDPAGQSRTLAIFAGLNIFALILIFFFVPETAGATLGNEEGSLNYISLEELNYIFGVRTRKHMAYQVKTVVPWAWKYYIRRREEDRRQDSPEQLYNWVRSQEEQQRRRRPRQARERISQEERRLGGASIGGPDRSPDILRG